MQAVMGEHAGKNVARITTSRINGDEGRNTKTLRGTEGGSA
jgi:hypothetical protein